ncbi:10712_t:CDS:1, partial [Paraglomus occultum]
MLTLLAETWMISLKKQLENWSKDSNILQTAKNKATKMWINLNKTIKRKEIKAFIDKQDLKFAE